MGISVCLASYNGEKYIVPQLVSILSQLKDDDEVIISDDCSTDDTILLINSLNDKRIRIVEGHHHYQSPIFNFENALKEVKNEFIFLSDQDDIWLPGKVNICINMLQDFDVIVTDAYIVNMELDILAASFFAINSSGSGFMKNLKRNSYLGCCMAFKRDVLLIALPFPKDIPMHDIWIGFIAELFFKPKFIDEKLLLYRRHNANKTTASQKSHTPMANRLMYRINLVKYLPIILWRLLKLIKQQG